MVQWLRWNVILSEFYRFLGFRSRTIAATEICVCLNRLMATRPEKFKTIVPFTTRIPRPHEQNGEEYHFVDRTVMEEDIRAHRFVKSLEMDNLGTL